MSDRKVVWDSVKRSMWYCFASALAAAAAARLMAEIPVIRSSLLDNVILTSISVDADDSGVPIAIAFFAIGYACIVPVLSARLIYLCRNMSLTREVSVREKVMLSTSIFAGAILVIAMPLIILSSYDIKYWKTQIIYSWMVHSYLGLSLVGGVLLYSTSVFISLLARFIPLLLIGYKESKHD